MPFYSDTQLLSVMYPDNLLPAKMSTFSKEDASPHCCANESSSFGELGSTIVHFNPQTLKDGIL